MPSFPRYVLYTSIAVAVTTGCSETDQPAPGLGSEGGGVTTGGQATSGASGLTASGGALTAGTSGNPAGGSGGGTINGGTAGMSAVATGGGSGIGGMMSTGGSGGGEPAPGCGNAAAPRDARHLTIEVNGTSRTYWLWVPNGYDPNKPIPVIFAWHGSGADGDEVRRKYFNLEPAVGDGAIIIYPDGLPVNGGGTGWDLAAEGIDVKLFDALLASVSQEYCVDQGRVFTTGYSFGGMFSHTLACSRGAKLRGMAPTAGSLRGVKSCPTPVAAWIAHAPNDNLVSFSSAEAARDVWLSTNGCGTTTMPVSPSPCVAYDCSDAPVHWCVHNEGHEWPSFAEKAMWAFFSSR